MTESKQSVVTLENRNKLTMTGVERVDAFSDRSILLTAAGGKVRIEGSGLKVLAFSEGSGNFAASGIVESIRFLAAGGKAGKLFR